MTPYAITDVPWELAATTVRTPGRPQGPMSTAATNVPALVLLLLGVVILCSVVLLWNVARHLVRPSAPWFQRLETPKASFVRSWA